MNAYGSLFYFLNAITSNKMLFSMLDIAIDLTLLTENMNIASGGGGTSARIYIHTFQLLKTISKSSHILSSL